MLEISASDRDRIRKLGEASYPHECCGFLLGLEDGPLRRVHRLYPARNENTESPRNRYRVAPEAFLGAEREAEVLGLTVLGVYHSHPDAEARPSEFDRTHALPGCSYAILAVREGMAAALRSWILRDDREAFLEEDLTVTGIPPALGSTP